MATYVEIVVKGKKVPSAICFIGNEQDQGKGSILVESIVRCEDGDYREPSKATFSLEAELSWQSPSGITMAEIAVALGQWYDYKMRPAVVLP